MSLAGAVAVSASAEKSSAISASGDMTSSTPFCLASSRISRATGNMSGSQIDLPTLPPLRRSEGVGHAAADDDRIDLLDQGLDHADLRRDLRTADDGAEGMLRSLHQRRDGPNLLLHQVAEHLVSREVLGDQVGRGVLAVRRAEGVVDVAVGVRGELLDELLLRTLLQGLLGSLLLLFGGVLGQTAGLALLLGVETQVLEQHHLARLDVAAHLGGLLAHAVAGEGDLRAEVLLDRGNDLLERVFGIGVLLRTTHVRHEDHRTALGQHLLDGGHGGADAGVVGHMALGVEGHVEVHADDRAFAFEIVVVDRNHSFAVFCGILLKRFSSVVDRRKIRKIFAETVIAPGKMSLSRRKGAARPAAEQRGGGGAGRRGLPRGWAGRAGGSGGAMRADGAGGGADGRNLPGRRCGSSGG